MKYVLLFLMIAMLPLNAFATTAGSRTTTGPSTLTLKKPQQCAPSGVPIGGNSAYQSCCPGLMPLNTSFPGGYNGQCNMPSLTPGHICSACGNGSCNAATGENICNCPQDCDPAL